MIFPRDWTWVYWIASEFFPNWATREAKFPYVDEHELFNALVMGVEISMYIPKFSAIPPTER